MVGGYVILAKNPLAIGANDITAMYGSLQNANSRITTLSSLQKPVLVEYNISVGGVNSKIASWFTVQSRINGVITLKSSVATLVYNETTGVATLTLTLNEG